MGCTSAKPDRTVPEMRRRLSLGYIGPPSKSESEEDLEEFFRKEKEEDRSLLMMLSKEQVLNMIESGEQIGRRFSIGSNTDKAMEKVPSFRSKSVALTGEMFEMNKEEIGFACKKGLKPESPNQDSFFILKCDQDFSIYGVFDGHGRKGHDISNFVKDLLPKILLMDPHLSKDPLQALANAFEQTQRLIVQATEMKKIDALRSGTTCSVIFNDHRTNTLHIAHVGDSRCVLGRLSSERERQPPISPPGSGGTGPSPGVSRDISGVKAMWDAVDLTTDHKPNLPEEKARIEAAGGRVVYDGGWNYRVYAKNHKGPGLNMSRAMGDLFGHYHAGISASPDVASHAITADPSFSIGAPSTDVNQFVDQDAGVDDVACPALTKSALSDINNQDAPKTQHSCGDAVSSKPSLTSYTLQPTDKFVLLCSDGVWEFMTSEEAVNLVGGFECCDAMQASQTLACVSWERWMRHMQGQVVDDITVVLVNLSPGVNAAPSGGWGTLSPSLASPHESFCASPPYSTTVSCQAKPAVGDSGVLEEESPVLVDGRLRSARGDIQPPEEEHNRFYYL